MKNIHFLCALVAIASGGAYAADNSPQEQPSDAPKKTLTIEDFAEPRDYNWQHGFGKPLTVAEVVKAHMEKCRKEVQEAQQAQQNQQQQQKSICVTNNDYNPARDGFGWSHTVTYRRVGSVDMSAPLPITPPAKSGNQPAQESKKQAK